MLTFTAPMIGNYGVEDAASESRRVQATRADLPRGAQLRAERPRGPARLAARARASSRSPGLDTRALVRHLRDRGAMLGVACGEGVAATRRARAARGRAADGRPRCSPTRSPASSTACRNASARCHVVVLDYGAKASIVRLLEQAGAPSTVLPARRHGRRGRRARARRRAARERARRSRLDGRARRRGARDGRSADARSTASASATSCSAARSGWRRSSSRSATAAPTTRCSRRASGRVLVTSQNHGFAVRAPENGDGALEVTHRSLYDGTVEGLRLRGRPGLEHAVPPRGLARAARRAREAGRVRRGLRRTRRGTC